MNDLKKKFSIAGYYSAYLIMFSTFMGALFTVLLKNLTDELNISTIAFFRFFFGLLIISPFIIKSKFKVLHTNNYKLYLFRSGLNLVGMLMYITAIGIMTLEKNAALGFIIPLYATILAVIILKEKIKIYRTVALIIGFIGVLIVIQPGLNTFEKGVIFALIGNFCVALGMIVVKKISKEDTSFTILSYLYIFSTLYTFIIYIFFWQIPDLRQIIILLIAAVLGTLGHYSFTQAIKISEVTFIAPFNYFALIWSSLFGYIIFKEIPNTYTWIGGSIIFISIMIITVREHSLKKDIVKKSIINHL